MSLLQRSTRSHGHRIKRSAGVRATYTPVDGSFEVLTLTMVPALRRMTGVTEQGVEIDREVAQWLCRVDELPRPPRRGDVITWLEKDVKYRVVHPGGGREYDHADQYQELYRIHSVVGETVIVDDTTPPPVDPDEDCYADFTDECYGDYLEQPYGPP